MKETSIPNILAVLPGIIPSTYMDVITPLKQLQEVGKIAFTITLDWLTSPEELLQADLVVFCRNSHPDINWATFLTQNNIPFIYDLDDNLFAIPPNTPLGQYSNREDVLQSITNYLKQATLVRVYSKGLLGEISALNKNCRLVQPPIDWPLFDGLQQKKSGKIKIVYPTSRGANDALSLIFLTALKKIVLEYPQSLEVYFLGAPIPEELKSLPNVHHWPFDKNYGQFMRRFYEEGFDIGLAPLKDDFFHQCKTNNKFREFAACGIAGVYSKTKLYEESVAHLENGLLVENITEAWYQAIKTLIEQPELRHSVRENSFKTVTRVYPRNAFALEWLNEINSALTSPHPLYLNSTPLDEQHIAITNVKKKNLPFYVNKLFSYTKEHGFRNSISLILFQFQKIKTRKMLKKLNSTKIGDL